jgi:hypothetical protein
VIEVNYSAKKLTVGIGSVALLIACAGINRIPIALGQTGSESHLQPDVGRAEGGEYNSLVLDVMLNECRETGNKVIIISHLGTRDTRADLHKRRLHNAVARLVDYSSPIPREQVRTAIENRVKGKGTVEFYVGGRLVYTVFFKPNADFMVDCCEVEPNYYPWYKAPKPKTKPHRNPK